MKKSDSLVAEGGYETAGGRVETTRMATLSPCEKYRYDLWRYMNGTKPAANHPFVLFIGLNPSTADATVDDPTIRKCMKFARSLDYQVMCMANLFAYRATDPKELKLVRSPVEHSRGENDMHLIELVERASLVIAAWGTHGTLGWRNRDVWHLIEDRKMVFALKITKGGHPQHPLYLRDDTLPVAYLGPPL